MAGSGTDDTSSNVRMAVIPTGSNAAKASSPLGLHPAVSTSTSALPSRSYRTRICQGRQQTWQSST
jgi:hypothetical protein